MAKNHPLPKTIRFFILTAIVAVTPLFPGQLPGAAQPYAWIPILVLYLFIALNSVPFLIAIRELRSPKDNTPLFIDMHYSKDPLFFGRKFRKMVDSILPPLFSQPGMHRIDLSKEEFVEISPATEIPPSVRFSHIFLGLGHLRTACNVTFAKELYVRGRAEIGNSNEIKAVYAEEDLILGDGAILHRWGYSKRNIIVGGNSLLGRNLAAEAAILIQPGCRFQSLFASPVCFSPDPDKINNLVSYQEETPGLPNQEESIQPAWIHMQNNLFFNIIPKEKAAPGHELDEKNGDIKTEKASWRFTPESTHLNAGSRIQCNVVNRRDLVVEEMCILDASLKSYGAIHLHRGVIVKGSLFAEGDIHIDEDCQIWGNVFSQSQVVIGPNTRIGRPGQVKSVICKKGLTVARDVEIYGYVLTEGDGTSI